MSCNSSGYRRIQVHTSNTVHTYIYVCTVLDVCSLGHQLYLHMKRTKSPNVSLRGEYPVVVQPFLRGHIKAREIPSRENILDRNTPK